MSDVQQPNQGSIGLGIGLTFALHAAALAICCVIAGVFGRDVSNGFAPFVGIGLTQVVYIGPACAVCAVKGRRRTLKGLLIGAGITFLLNAACFGITLALLANADFR
jgi:hypothetical protein